MKNKAGHRVLILACIAMLMLLFCSSCARNKNANNADIMSLPPVASFADDIRDITLPSEMEWIREESMIIKTESFRGGIYRYNGRVEVLSLKDYLAASMQDNKWRLVGETASKDFMLAFVKPNKTCMMIISEKYLGKVELTLYITIDQTASGNVNAFGESIIH